jgi:hypothetical protein
LVELNTMGTNSGWVVGWADLAALVALPVKPDEFGPGIRFALVCPPGRHPGDQACLNWISSVGCSDSILLVVIDVPVVARV